MMMLLVACSSTPPILGMVPCPKRPNCVSSLAEKSSDQRVEPLTNRAGDPPSWDRLHTIISKFDGALLVTERADYRHYTISTPTLGFTDDLEFSLRQGVLHVRSASRVGYSDMGVNRARVDSIRNTIQNQHTR